MVSTELQIAAFVVAFLAIGLLVQVFMTLRPEERSEMDAGLDDIINGYDFQVPPEFAAYKKMSSDPSKSEYVCLGTL